MKKIIISTLMIAALAACQKSEEQSPEIGGSSEVTFNSAILTRATDTSVRRLCCFRYNGKK